MTRRNDDHNAILSVFSLYEKKMYHMAYAILHDVQQAEDAVMNAFVRLLEHDYPIGDPASDAAKRLIISVTRSAAIDLYRKNARERERSTLSADPAVLSKEDGTEADWSACFSESVGTLIADLPPIYRDVLYYRYAKELSTAETAAALGITETTVRKRRQRALDMLRKKKMDKGGCYEPHFRNT